MNDNEKFQQLGDELRLTEEQAKVLAERMPQTGALQVLDEPMCMAKRIEGLEAQVRGLVWLLRKAKPYVKDCADWGRKHDADLRDYIEAALAGKLPTPAVPEGWQLVPVEPTNHMTWVGQSMRYDSEISIGSIYCAMLAAAPNPWSKP